MILPLSLNRLDRLPLHFSRWKGEMSIVIQCNEEEIMDLITVISDIKRMNIRFTFYIVKHLDVESKCSFKTKDGSLIYYKTCYVINELRNLAIETIQTTHYMLIDGDAIISCISSFNF